ncbi:MAG: thioesterase family protein [Candidatus Binatia bacterium]
MDKFDRITPGITDQRPVTVKKEHVVSPTGTAVLSTPMMIAWMELTSADLVRPFLPVGFATVGYEVQVKHKAAALLGSELTVSSKLLEADGRKLLFEVQVTEGEKIIGTGLHRRTIVPKST